MLRNNRALESPAGKAGGLGVWFFAALGWFALLTSPAVAHRIEGDPSFSLTGEGGTFIRGDANQDGQLDLSDAVAMLGYLYLGTAQPTCMDALDADDSGDLDITDAVDTLSYLFLGSFTISAPFPAPGIDPTDAGLLCDNGRFAVLRDRFASTCATSSCHSAATAKGGLNLEGTTQYSQLYQSKPTNAVALSAGLLRVRPGFPEKSLLYKVVSGTLAAGEGDPAIHAGLLTESQIELVEHWIKDGAPPSTYRDVILPAPASGEQIMIPPFSVAAGKEVQRNYFFKLKADQDIWVDRIEFLYPPGSHHLNLFTGAPVANPDGSFEDNFKVVPFGTWDLRASSQTGRLDWRLPAGSAMKFKAHEQILAQIHFVNVASQLSPIGGCAAINLHAAAPGATPKPMGAMFLQNKNIKVTPHTEVDYPNGLSIDYGITFNNFAHNIPVKIAAVTGHFHWRGKTFEIRKWDGKNKYASDDSIPISLRGTPLPGEFERMGPENTIFLSDNWDEPPFNLFTEEDAPEIPEGWGVVYRTTYVNTSDTLYCFGPFVETKEHANAFLYFYPGAVDGSFYWFPPDCAGQGCTVPCP